MTDIGSKRDRGEDESAGDGRFHFTDKRRLDPETGELRDSVKGAARATDASPEGGPMTSNAGGAAALGASPDGGGADELAAARAEAAERTADLQRVSAEYANYRKRTDRDKQQAMTVGKAAVMGEMLAILDDLDRADEHGDLTGGFKTVADKITETLQRLGLGRFGTVGDEFDPNVHEAVQFATSAEVDHPTVTTVLRVGYMFDERVLRPAVVLVTGPEHEADGAAAAEESSPDGESVGGEADPDGFGSASDDARAGEPGKSDA